MGTGRDGEVGDGELNFYHMVFAVFAAWCSAADSTKLGPPLATKVGFAATTPSCLLASRYSCYSNVIVKQR